jgi:hypothetical protein
LESDSKRAKERAIAELRRTVSECAKAGLGWSEVLHIVAQQGMPQLPAWSDDPLPLSKPSLP